MKRKLIQCATRVNRNAITRKTINGVEHIIISSYTLPDNIVMNGGLYPAEEIAKSFLTLERTLAPVEHPQDSDGNYISAADPTAIHNYHAGAFNINVEKDGDRIKIDKCINVQEAMKTERGKRLLDRINEIETSDNPRPIHTSTGVFLVPEMLNSPQVNKEGQEYTWIAREMVFDHDAILLNSVGAAQPSQGVGIGVNTDGEEFEIERFVINEDNKNNINTKNQSMSDLHRSVQKALEDIGLISAWIDELFDDKVVFSSGEELFIVPYVVDDNGIVTIMGIPLPVERNVTFTPKNNSQGEAMKDFILNLLKKAGIEVAEDVTDDQLIKQYDEFLIANQQAGDSNLGDGNNNAEIAEIITSALKPLSDKLDGLEKKFNSQQVSEKAEYVEAIVKSNKYPGLDAESASMLNVEKLKEMAANCGFSHGVSPIVNHGSEDEKFQASSDMPE